MKAMETHLSQRQTFLQNLVEEKERAISHAPDGLLRICNYKNKPRYYHRDDPKDFNGHYIRSEKTYFAAQLAQKDYDLKVLAAAQKELDSIDALRSIISQHKVEDIYPALHPARQSLITPIQLPDNLYLEKWLAYEYEKKSTGNIWDLWTIKNMQKE